MSVPTFAFDAVTGKIAAAAGVALSATLLTAWARRGPPKPCEVCGGIGYWNCVICDGQGFQLKGRTKTKCPACVGRGKRLCKECTGSGWDTKTNYIG